MNKPAALSIGGILVAAAGVATLAITSSKPVPPPASGCKFVIVAEAADNTQHVIPGEHPLCPDRVVFDGKIYWFAQQDLKTQRMIYRQHVAPKPPTLPTTPPAKKPVKPPAKGPTTRVGF